MRLGEITLDSNRLTKPLLGLVQAIPFLLGESKMEGSGWTNRALVALPDENEIFDRARRVSQFETHEPAIESRVDEVGLAREDRLEDDLRFLRFTREEERKPLEVGFSKISGPAPDTFECLERSLDVTVSEKVRADAAVRPRRSLRRSLEWNQEQECGEGGRGCANDQAAPRTWSSGCMSPALYAFAKAATTCGSNRESAKLTIFSTTYPRSMAF